MYVWLVILAITVTLIVLGLCGKEYFDSSKVGTSSYRTVDIKGYPTLIHKVQGNNGERVILLHVSPMNQMIWDPLLEYFQNLALAGNQIPTLISYDLRGHGTAWRPVESHFNDTNIHNTAWSFNDFADDLNVIVQSQVPSGQKVTLVGYGFGASVAQQYAIDHPDIINKLILLAPFIKPMPISTNHIKYMADYIALYPNINDLPQDKQLYDAYLCLWFEIDDKTKCPLNTDDKGDQSDSYLYHYAKQLLRTASTITHLQTDKLLSSTDFTKQWVNARIPYDIEIVTGTRDTLIPSDTAVTGYNTIKKVKPETAFKIVDGKHGFVLTNLAEVARLICPECTITK